VPAMRRLPLDLRGSRPRPWIGSNACPCDAALTLNAAPWAFRKAWRELLPTLREANFQRWREQRDFTEIRDARLRLPDADTERRWPVPLFCCEVIDVADTRRHVYEAHRSA
jgi:hypothetical protein